MTAGYRAKLFVVAALSSLGATVATAAALLTDPDLYGWPLLVAAAASLVAAAAIAGLGSTLASQPLRPVVAEARAAAGREHGDVAGLGLGETTALLQRAIRDLVRERERIQLILDGMSDAVLAVDQQQRISLANPAAVDLLGLVPPLAGRPLAEAARTSELVGLVEQGTEQATTEIEIELPGKPARRVRARATPLEPSGGRVVVLDDVTEMRRLETVRRDFVANVSHELRTPISVVRANAETLLDGALDGPSALGFVQAIERNAVRLGQLVSDLLDLSRIEAGTHPLVSERVALSELVGRVIETTEKLAQGRDHTITPAVDPALEVRVDRSALEQILVNLLDNAVKYTPEGGRIQVRAEPREGRVRLEVEDDGPGIAPQHRQRIFERFFRVDKSRSRALGGTGLGLAIARHLAEAMGGRIGIRSAGERGSVFWVDLPATERARSNPGQAEAGAGESR